MPVNAVSQPLQAVQVSAAIRTLAPPWTTNRRYTRSAVGLRFPPSTSLPASGPPVGSRQEQHARRLAGDLGTRTPPGPSFTAAWPSAGRAASKSASERPAEGLPNPEVDPRVPPGNP